MQRRLDNVSQERFPAFEASFKSPTVISGSTSNSEVVPLMSWMGTSIAMADRMRRDEREVVPFNRSVTAVAVNRKVQTLGTC